MDREFPTPGQDLDRAIADALGLTCAPEECPPFSTDWKAADDIATIMRAQVYTELVPTGVSVIMLSSGLSRQPKPHFKGHAVGQTREHAICLAALDLIHRHGMQVYGSRVSWTPTGK